VSTTISPFTPTAPPRHGGVTTGVLAAFAAQVLQRFTDIVPFQTEPTVVFRAGHPLAMQAGDKAEAGASLCRTRQTKGRQWQLGKGPSSQLQLRPSRSPPGSPAVTR
jgi:hypothetical protein